MVISWYEDRNHEGTHMKFKYIFCHFFLLFSMASYSSVSTRYFGSCSERADYEGSLRFDKSAYFETDWSEDSPGVYCSKGTYGVLRSSSCSPTSCSDQQSQFGGGSSTCTINIEEEMMKQARALCSKGSEYSVGLWQDQNQVTGGQQVREQEQQ